MKTVITVESFLYKYKVLGIDLSSRARAVSLAQHSRACTRSPVLFIVFSRNDILLLFGDERFLLVIRGFARHFTFLSRFE